MMPYIIFYLHYTFSVWDVIVSPSFQRFHLLFVLFRFKYFYSTQFNSQGFDLAILFKETIGHNVMFGAVIADPFVFRK